MTTDTANIALFGTLASDWWDPEGASRLLHRINPTRLEYIRDAIVAHFGRDPKSRHVMSGLNALDIGCGGGLVAEPLARMGAAVTGIDAGEEVIAAARAHAQTQDLPITYIAGDLIQFAKENAGRFDFISCLEVVEHVTDIPEFLKSIATLLTPGGLLVFSTPNRTPISWAVLIAGAEKITRMIPESGHDWRQFVTPDELTQMLATAGLRTEKLNGLSWSLAKGFHISADLSINYIGTAVHG